LAEAIPLSPPLRRFIQHWGEMGTRWGVNRTVAQIHALLYVAPDPLTADEIQATLRIARSNVSTSLRELQGWGIIRASRDLGDRKDRFESIRDVWEMFRIIAEERKRREVDPTLAVLRDSVAELRRMPSEREPTRRLGDLLDLMETVEAAYQEMRTTSAAEIRTLLKLRGGLRRLLRLGLRRSAPA
jgi:DNA-binding transcriptional regulator GbsR (MarR family)